MATGFVSTSDIYKFWDLPIFANLQESVFFFFVFLCLLIQFSFRDARSLESQEGSGGDVSEKQDQLSVTGRSCNGKTSHMVSVFDRSCQFLTSEGVHERPRSLFCYKKAHRFELLEQSKTVLVHSFQSKFKFQDLKFIVFVHFQ